MKPRKLTLISLTLLTLLVFGTVILIISTGQEPLIADQVKFTPKSIVMGNTADLQVEVKLIIGEEPDTESVVDKIDNTTVLLEFIAPTNSWVTYDKKGKPDTFVAVFDGSAVEGLIWYMVYHMGIKVPPNPGAPLTVRLEITGELYEGTLWEGSALAVVWNWEIGETPPPPPPP